MHHSRGKVLVNLAKKRVAEQSSHGPPCKKRLFGENPFPASFNEGNHILRNSNCLFSMLSYY